MIPSYTEQAQERIKREWGCRKEITHGTFEKYDCSWCKAFEFQVDEKSYRFKMTPVIAEGVFEHSKGEKEQFCYVTTFAIDKENVEDIIETGRTRWQIELAFRVLKHSELALENVFGTRDNAALNYFMITQLAFLVRTLIENTNYFEKLAALETTGQMNRWNEIRRADIFNSGRSMIRTIVRYLQILVCDFNRLKQGTHLSFIKNGTLMEASG